MVPVSPSRSKACPDQLSLIALTVTRCRSSAALHSSPVTYRPAMMRSVCNRGTRASQRSTMVSSGLSLTITDNPLDTIVLRWLARVPRLQTDRIIAGRYVTGEECKAALERHLVTVKAINDSWSGHAFEREGDTGTIHYFPDAIVYARAALRCAEQ